MFQVLLLFYHSCAFFNVVFIKKLYDKRFSSEKSYHGFSFSFSLSLLCTLNEVISQTNCTWKQSVMKKFFSILQLLVFKIIPEQTD